MKHSHARYGFTIAELLATIVSVTLILTLVLPVIGQMRSQSGVEVSLSNLAALGAAHALYAADWKGRQFTNIPDEMSIYGKDADSGYAQYESVHGEAAPPLLLGWGSSDGSYYGLWGYWMSMPGNYGITAPITFQGAPAHMHYFGIFRVPNAKPFHDYVNGRFYEPTFYAPNDTVPWALVEPFFDYPDEFWGGYVAEHGHVAWSSYCFSPAAMFDPAVMRAVPDGGWQDPWDAIEGHQCPGLYHALYPDLKTLMIEHHWNQNPPPDPCNPAFEEGTYDGCEPYYFNHALASEPATLFYDMSVRLLPNTEVLAADEWLINQTGYGLWSRDTPFGEDGYFSDVAYDFTQLSHHILTTDGIRGRDTLPPGALNPARAAR